MARIVDSTTGWAIVKKAIGPLATILVANVLQMPLPPKAYRRETDKIDTGRILREFLNGSLPVAFQPSDELRQIRRLVATRESLVSRRTALRNWINLVIVSNLILNFYLLLKYYMRRRVALKNLGLITGSILFLPSCNFSEEKAAIALNKLQITKNTRLISIYSCRR